MAGPGDVVPLSGTPPPQPRRFGWFWRSARQHPAAGSEGGVEDPLLALGRQLRERREQRQLTLRELALETRISTPVLEALERGWRDRLPEATYLRTMLPLIERHLELQPGSLVDVLPVAPAPRPGRQQPGLLRRFTPGSIDVFTSWQGTVLYGVITLGLVYGLNLQQHRLAQEGLLAVTPMRPGEQDQRPAANLSLLTIEPGLRPLEQASRGEALGMIKRESAASGPAAAAPQRGTLVLQLDESAQLSLKSANGVTTSLTSSGGRLAFDLTAPWTLRIDPPPKGTTPVRWREKPLAATPGQPGQFQPAPP